MKKYVTDISTEIFLWLYVLISLGSTLPFWILNL